MSTASTLKLKWLAFLAVYTLLALTFIWLFMVHRERSQTQALRELGVSAYPQARLLSPFNLQQQNQQTFTREDLRGRWNLVFFGFTHCPDICPLTMRELDQFYRRLGESANIEAPRVVMATVDPGRDTPSRMGEYLRGFHPDFIGLTGNPAQLEALASELYVVSASAQSHTEHPASPASAELSVLNHSGHLSLINPQAELVAVLRLPHRADDIDTAYRHFASR